MIRPIKMSLEKENDHPLIRTGRKSTNISPAIFTSRLTENDSCPPTHLSRKLQGNPRTEKNIPENRAPQHICHLNFVLLSLFMQKKPDWGLALPSNPFNVLDGSSLCDDFSNQTFPVFLLFKWLCLNYYFMSPLRAVKRPQSAFRQPEVPFAAGCS